LELEEAPPQADGVDSQADTEDDFPEGTPQEDVEDPDADDLHEGTEAASSRAVVSFLV